MVKTEPFFNFFIVTPAVDETFLFFAGFMSKLNIVQEVTTVSANAIVTQHIKHIVTYLCSVAL